MTYQPTDFKTALDMDMAMRGINERVLGERIGVSQQAISKWRARGFPPAYRWQQLRDLLGPDSYVSRLAFPELVSTGHRLRVEPPSNVPPVPESARVNRVATSARSLTDSTSADAAWARVQSLLPEGLRTGGARTTLRVGQISAAVDYVAPLLALDFVVAGKATTPVNLSQPLLKLAALRASNPALRVVLCLLAPEGAEVARGRLAYGDALGVETWVVASEAEAAARIARASAEAPEPPDTPE